MSDSADEGDGWGGATPGGGGDMGPNSGSVVVFGVTFHGVVALATRQQYLLHNNNYIYIGKTWEEAEKISNNRVWWRAMVETLCLMRAKDLSNQVVNNYHNYNN